MSDKEIRIRGKNIVYTGAGELLQYVFKTINHCNVNKENQTGVFVDITLGRPLTSNVMTVFLPTFMLLIISQMSTLFSSNYLDLVIDVNVTVLLVLTTLYRVASIAFCLAKMLISALWGSRALFRAQDTLR